MIGWSEEGFDGEAMAMHVDRIMKEFESEKMKKLNGSNQSRSGYIL